MNPVVLKTTGFTYNSARRQFLGNATALGLTPPFPDKLTLVSHKTNKFVVYRKTGEKKDPATGQLLGVGYVPTPESLRAVKTCWGTRIVIICETNAT